jgi:hypothetical protein
MKQTAVEWYGLQIGILISKFFNNEISKSEVHFKRIEIEEQAKEMEKQQIIDAWKDGAYGGGQFTTTFDNEEQYYNETFKNQLQG